MSLQVVCGKKLGTLLFGVSILSAVGGDNTWSTEEGNGKPLQHSCLENTMNSMKRQKDMTLKDELPRLVPKMLLEKSG